jgi:hypothetical protein
MSVPLLTAISPPESLCSSSLAGWRCRSRLSSCCCWRGLASNLNTLRSASSFRQPSSPTSERCPWGRRSFPLLPPAFGGKDVHQPREGGQRAKSRLHLSCPPQLLGVGSEPCCGSISLALMDSVSPPMVTVSWLLRTLPGGSYKTSYAMEMAAARFQRGGDGGRVLLARPYWCRVGHTCRHKVGPHLKADVITFVFVRYF